MDTNRRTFLQWASVAPAIPVAAAAAPGTVAPDAAHLSRATFTPLRGETFVFEKDALQSEAARLVAVDPLDAAANDERSFRLLFEVPTQALPQGTFNVSHPRLGRFALFVSPSDAEGRILEAVFNRV